MSSLPQITVIVPTYNRAHYLGTCLESLLEQTLPAHQVIVVNDGSTDTTPDVLARFAGQVEVLRTPQGGKSVAVNRALPEVTGDYVWIFDDDDVALPDTLERFVAPLERSPDHGFSYATFYFSVNRRRDTRLGHAVLESRIPELTKGLFVEMMERNFLGGAAIFVRKRCYDEVGPFDPRLRRAQDTEMALRLARRFSGVRVEGGPAYHHRQHGGARGGAGNRIASVNRMRGWLEYDRIIFAELHEELELQEYLPPGTPLAGHRRHAVLQRMAIMALRLLGELAAEDVRTLAELGDDRPFTDPELAIIRGPLVAVPQYGADWILDDPAFVSALADTRGRSPAAEALTTEIERAREGGAGRVKEMRERISTFRTEHLGAESPDPDG